MVAPSRGNSKYLYIWYYNIKLRGSPVTVFRKKLHLPKHAFELQIKIYAYVGTANAWLATFYKKTGKPLFANLNLFI